MTIEERFWSKVDKSAGPDGCWLWMAGTSDGYGRFRAYGRRVRAHRFAYVLMKGPIPFGMEVLHKCDNRPCCNPDHLWPGTDLDNMQDAATKGRLACGELHGSHIHPERLARGDLHGSHTHPERVARGEFNGSHTHPERLARGERQGIAKLTEVQVREIRRLFAEGQAQRVISRLMGVSPATVWDIVHHLSWRHIPLEIQEGCNV